MMDHDDTSPSDVAFWASALVRWPEDVVARMRLGPEDSAYLTGTGLLVGIDWNLRIEAPAAGVEPARVGHAPVVAHDWEVPLCVDLARGGTVVAFEPDQIREVNSNVRAFGAFLRLYQEYRLRVRGLGEDEAQALVDEIARRMSEKDPAAMRSPESYWSVIVEQLQDGLL